MFVVDALSQVQHTITQDIGTPDLCAAQRDEETRTRQNGGPQLYTKPTGNKIDLWSLQWSCRLVLEQVCHH